MTTVDVGCGTLRLGTVNLDIRREVNPDIVCDAHYLPLQSSVSERTFCYCLLEHVENPIKVVKEIKRITVKDGYVTIAIPRYHFTNVCIIALTYLILYSFLFPPWGLRKVFMLIPYANVDNPDVFHRTCIRKSFFDKYFKVIDIRGYGSYLDGFMYGRKGKLFNQFLRNRCIFSTSFLIHCVNAEA